MTDEKMEALILKSQLQELLTQHMDENYIERAFVIFDNLFAEACNKGWKEGFKEGFKAGFNSAKER